MRGQHALKRYARAIAIQGAFDWKFGTYVGTRAFRAIPSKQCNILEIPAPRVVHMERSPNAETDGLSASINVELQPDCRTWLTESRDRPDCTYFCGSPFFMLQRMSSR